MVQWASSWMARSWSGGVLASVGMGHAASGRQSRTSSVKGQAPRSMSTMAASPSARVRSATASEIRPRSTGPLQFVLVLPPPLAFGIDEDVELEVAHVEAERCAAEGFLEVHIPAEELPGGGPHDPCGAPLAGDHEPWAMRVFHRSQTPSTSSHSPGSQRRGVSSTRGTAICPRSPRGQPLGFLREARARRALRHPRRQPWGARRR